VVEKATNGGDGINNGESHEQKDLEKKIDATSPSPYDGGSSEHGDDGKEEKEDSPGLGAYFVRYQSVV